MNSHCLGFKYYMTTRMILLIERSRDILTADEVSHYMDQILQIKNDSIANGCEFDLNLSPQPAILYGAPLIRIDADHSSDGKRCEK